MSFTAIEFIPKIPKVGDHLPVPILVTILFTIINYFWLETKTVGDIREVNGSFPTVSIPDIDLDLGKVFKLAYLGLEFALIGLIESLLTL